ncbi:hypothetical protein AAG570_013362 [Ranatra chinensis]|uniref:Uncharacterized protein n=1 Tax=Ranatra chinensis TaxID=642074 RepID=A0ABD0YYC4_9HEMI
MHTGWALPPVGTTSAELGGVGEVACGGGVGVRSGVRRGEEGDVRNSESGGVDWEGADGRTTSTPDDRLTAHAPAPLYRFSDTGRTHVWKRRLLPFSPVLLYCLQPTGTVGAERAGHLPHGASPTILLGPHTPILVRTLNANLG